MPDVTEIIHHGRTTLPALDAFQKRFAHAGGGSRRLFGYNEGAARSLIGPGCFGPHDTAGNPAWETCGAWVVDDFMVPDGHVQTTWPKVEKNSQGL